MSAFLGWKSVRKEPSTNSLRELFQVAIEDRDKFRVIPNWTAGSAPAEMS